MGPQLHAITVHPSPLCPLPDEKHFEDNLEELRLRWRIEVAPAAPQNTQPQRTLLEQPSGGEAGAAADAASRAAGAGAPVVA